MKLKRRTAGYIYPTIEESGIF